MPHVSASSWHKDRPEIRLSFTIRDGYEVVIAARQSWRRADLALQVDDAAGVDVHLTCAALSRAALDGLNAWARQRVADGEGGGMEVLGVCMSVGDAVEASLPPAGRVAQTACSTGLRIGIRL